MIKASSPSPDKVKNGHNFQIINLVEIAVLKYLNNNDLNYLLNVLALILGVALTPIIGGCSTTSKTTAKAHNPPMVVKAKPIKLSKTSIKQLLTKQHQDWKGTPYKLGGNSKKGIDCSGFVQITFKQKLGISVPRTTSKLSKTGKTISRNQLTTGDLVFFSTGFSKRHVGIYIGNGNFLHASTSKGVMISSINSPYWSKHYWKSTRILSI